MAVFKRFQGKRITSKHPAYSQARWWVYKRVKGHKTLHQSIPEAITKQDAELAERQLLSNLFNRTYGIPDGSTTFSGFVDKTYTKYIEQNNVNKGAKTLYIQILKDHFGDKVLTTLTPQDCRDCQLKLQYTKHQRGETYLSPSSVNRIMSTASKIFSLACEEGILDRNPMQYVKSLREPPRRKRLLTSAQKRRFWEQVKKDVLMMRLVTLAINLPLRRGQLLAITPEVIDFDRKLLFVIASKGRPPRPVPMNQTVQDTLRAMIRDRQLPFPITDFRKRWHPLLIAAGINKKDGTREENFHFHDLRTEFATELIKKNVNPKHVQDLFAHSDMSITDVYLGEDMEGLFDAVNSLDATILQPTQETTGLPN